jgi:hypothetical protein
MGTVAGAPARGRLRGETERTDISLSSETVHAVRIRCGEHVLEFLTTLTVFNAPQSVRLEELHIESYFPLDETTERVCMELARN